jgi:hypothetical protein
VDVTQFKVQTPALAAAAPVINSAAGHAGSAQRAATAAAGQEGAFGGEPIGAVFAEMCGRAQGATSELEQTGQTLARNQLDRSDLIPPGVKEALSHVVYYRGVYRTYAERLYYLLRGAMKP